MKKNKTCTIRFRCTEQEYKLLTEISTQNFKSRSDYIRQIGLSSDNGSSINPDELICITDEQTCELRTIGYNINQLTRYANHQGRIANDAMFTEFIREFECYCKVLNHVLSTYKQITALK